MDIIDFINSRDIRSYLHEIDYKLRTDEAAFIVFFSNRSLRDKINAWKWIAENMPVIRRETIHHRFENFNDVLSCFVKLQEKKEREFKANPNKEYIYTFSGEFHNKSSDSYSRQSEGEYYFTSFDELVKAIVSDNNEEEEWTNVIIHKHKIDSRKTRPDDSVDINTKGDILWVDLWEINNPDVYDGSYDSENDLADIDIMFETMFFNIPTPFKRGDIIIDINGRYRHPIVLDYMVNWDEQRMADEGVKILKRGQDGWHDRWLSRAEDHNDYSDMNAYTLAYSTDYGVYDPDMVPLLYLDLEYFRDELKGGERCLKALSSFMQGQINEELYTLAITKIRGEDQQVRVYQKWNKEILELAGLPVDDEFCWEKRAIE